MARWTVQAIAEVPIVPDGDPDNAVWYPLQHALGIDTFGVNLFVASGAGHGGLRGDEPDIDTLLLCQQW